MNIVEVFREAPPAFGIAFTVGIVIVVTGLVVIIGTYIVDWKRGRKSR